MEPQDLYSIEIPDDAYQTPCGGNIGGSLESCVEYADIPEHPGALSLRDSKLGKAGPELRFSSVEMASFFDAVAPTPGATA